MPAGVGALEERPMSAQQAVVATKGQCANWLEMLARYDVRFVILNTRLDDELLRLVQSEPEWTVDLVDGETILFARIQTPKSVPVPA
jgi:hypothetical protein